MSDVVVTLPLKFRWGAHAPGLPSWLAEGDPAGSDWSGMEYHFTVGGGRPRIEPGERVYVVHGGRLIGFAPLIRVACPLGRFELVRGGGAVAVTIDEPIPGFRGFRYRWWDRGLERPYPGWRHTGRAA